ncbi:hypothetical protein Nepgr_007453 [Nepenthes gracilis]|uniref:Uncharacterized protein n=1 Tax=Nepenthes gracilis TaxID=150966 RepID=A0AAD3S6W4_NEPGR|nr:hypothetical protein Nepgr_007453 [Nepenthes gracilis]
MAEVVTSKLHVEITEEHPPEPSAPEAHLEVETEGQVIVANVPLLEDHTAKVEYEVTLAPIVGAFGSDPQVPVFEGDILPERIQEEVEVASSESSESKFQEMANCLIGVAKHFAHNYVKKDKHLVAEERSTPLEREMIGVK